MLIDKLAEFCDATALNTGGADNYFIGVAVDANIGRDLGQDGLYLVITVDTSVDSASDNTVQQFQLRSDSTSSVDPDTGTVHITTPAFTQAQLAAGARYYYPLPMEGLAYERYLGIVQITSVAAATAGKINAFIIPHPPKWKAFTDASN